MKVGTTGPVAGTPTGLPGRCSPAIVRAEIGLGTTALPAIFTLNFITSSS
jgi:hypothetical protein